MTDKDLIELHMKFVQRNKSANINYLAGAQAIMEEICHRLDLERNLNISSKSLPIET